MQVIWGSTHVLMQAVMSYVDNHIEDGANAKISDLQGLKSKKKEARRSMMDMEASPELPGRGEKVADKYDKEMSLEEVSSAEESLDSLRERALASMPSKKSSKAKKVVKKKTVKKVARDQPPCEMTMHLTKIGVPWMLTQDVPGKGACFYESIAVLEKLENENAGTWNHQDYRNLVVAKARSTLEEAGMFKIHFSSEEEFNLHASKQALPNTWTSGAWILVLALTLKRNILIITPGRTRTSLLSWL